MDARKERRSKRTRSALRPSQECSYFNCIRRGDGPVNPKMKRGALRPISLSCRSRCGRTNESRAHNKKAPPLVWGRQRRVRSWNAISSWHLVGHCQLPKASPPFSASKLVGGCCASATVNAAVRQKGRPKPIERMRKGRPCGRPVINMAVGATGGPATVSNMHVTRDKEKGRPKPPKISHYVSNMPLVMRCMLFW